MSSYNTEDIKKAINRYLKIREHSRKELQHKLLIKNFNEELHAPAAAATSFCGVAPSPE